MGINDELRDLIHDCADKVRMAWHGEGYYSIDGEDGTAEAWDYSSPADLMADLIVDTLDRNCECELVRVDENGNEI